MVGCCRSLYILTTNNKIKCNTSLGIITREMRVINFPLLSSNRKSPDISNFPPRQFVIKFHEPKNQNQNGGLSGKEKNVLLLLFLLIYKTAHHHHHQLDGIVYTYPL